MNALLTAQEVQELIHVDKSTVYRMAEDGRLPGIKVGRQWRFPADQVVERLGLERLGLDLLEPANRAPTTSTGANDNRSVLSVSDVLTPETLQSTAEMLAETFGRMTVITDMQGRPLTTVVNPCGFYGAVADRPETEAVCLAGWKELADRPHLAPRFVRSHLHFLCARAFVWVDRTPIGMVVVGGVTPDQWPPASEQLQAIADELNVPIDVVEAHVHETFDLTSEQRHWVLRVLPEIVDMVSLLASARSRLNNHPQP
jgi:excisionase family DNA binding protein